MGEWFSCEVCHETFRDLYVTADGDELCPECHAYFIVGPFATRVEARNEVAPTWLDSNLLFLAIAAVLCTLAVTLIVAQIIIWRT